MKAENADARQARRRRSSCSTPTRSTSRRIPFKTMMKLTVRRTVTNGVGYVKLGFERVMEQQPDLEKGIADATERLATLERLAADHADDITDENDKEAEQLRLLIEDHVAAGGIRRARGPDVRLPAGDQHHPRHQDASSCGTSWAPTGWPKSSC